jgi:hypothetical protein
MDKTTTSVSEPATARLHQKFRDAYDGGVLYVGGSSYTWTLLDDYFQPHSSMVSLSRELHTLRTTDGLLLQASPNNIIAPEDLASCHSIFTVSVSHLEDLPVSTAKRDIEDMSILETSTMLSEIFRKARAVTFEDELMKVTRIALCYSDIHPGFMECDAIVEFLHSSAGGRSVMRSIVVFIPNNVLLQLKANARSAMSMHTTCSLLAIPSIDEVETKKINVITSGKTTGTDRVMLFAAPTNKKQKLGRLTRSSTCTSGLA